MSTRQGQFTSLRELMTEVSPGAARFFFINRKAEQHLDFDLDLIKEQSKDNPLYYIQYAHARTCSVFRKLKSKNIIYDENLAITNISNLSSSKEKEIQRLLSRYPEVILRAAKNYEPHLICYYLKDLAANFHSYYNDEKILVEEPSDLHPRLFLLSAVKQVLRNGLVLLGVDAPSSM